MKKRRGEVPAWIRLPRVPVYNQPGRSVAIELKDRICPICHRNDLESANRKGELVAVEGKPAHLACAEKKDPAKKAEPAAAEPQKTPAPAPKKEVKPAEPEEEGSVMIDSKAGDAEPGEEPEYRPPPRAKRTK